MNVQTMQPIKSSYAHDDELGDEFCKRLGCSECHSTEPESYEPTGYGCDIQEQWIAKYMHLVK